MDDQDLMLLVHRGEETRDLDYEGPAAWNESDKKARQSTALGLLYETLGVQDEEVTWRVTLQGTQNRTLQDRSGRRHVPPWWTSPIGTIEHEQRHAVEDWRAGLIDHAVEASRDIFHGSSGMSRMTKSYGHGSRAL